MELAGFRGIVSTVDGAHVDGARLAEERSAFRRVAELVARGTGPAAVLQAIAAETCTLVGVDSTGLLRVESDGSSRIVALHDAPSELSIGDRLPAAGEGVVQRVLRSGRTASVDS